MPKVAAAIFSTIAPQKLEWFISFVYVSINMFLTEILLQASLIVFLAAFLAFVQFIPLVLSCPLKALISVVLYLAYRGFNKEVFFATILLLALIDSLSKAISSFKLSDHQNLLLDLKRNLLSVVAVLLF